MITSSEVNNNIKRLVGKRHASHVVLNQLGMHLPGADSLFGLGEQITVEVEAYETRWPAKFGERRERNAAAASHFENSFSLGQIQRVNHEGNFDIFLRRIPSRNIRERTITIATKRCLHHIAVSTAKHNHLSSPV
jgi:hypothetical protein